MVCAGYKKMVNIIFLACAAAFGPTATTALLPVIGRRCTLNITKVRNGNHHIFIFNKIEHIYFVAYIHDLRFTLITKFFFYFYQFTFDDIVAHIFIGKDQLQVFNQLHDLGMFFTYLINLHPGQSLQT